MLSQVDWFLVVCRYIYGKFSWRSHL